MFDACEGCGSIPDHRIDGPKCVANRADAVRVAQAHLDEQAERNARSDQRLRREHEMLREMVD